MLRILQSNRLEELADCLIGSLAEAPARLPQREVVLVPQLAMGRWLECRIADALGICAHIEFPFAAQFIWRSFGEVLPAVAAYSPFDRGLLALRLFEFLQRLPAHPDYAPLRVLLAGADARRRLDLADHLAARFDQYLIYRPDWLETWGQQATSPAGSSPTARWQRRLWHHLVADLPASALQHPRHAYFEQLAQSAPARAQLPARVRLFAPPILPPLYVEIFARLAQHTTVEWYVLNPCREYWADIVSERQQARLQLAGDAQAREVGHALLASWGTQARDNLRLVADHIGESGSEDQEAYREPSGTQLLGRLQASILNLADPPLATLEVDDRSIQVHVCHSLTRQFEVLHDQLLRLFESLPDLRPHQVLVLSPDIDASAPVIEAVFGAAPPARHIPWLISGRRRNEASPLLRAFATLLDLPGSRFTAADVLDFLHQPPVARRYDLQAAELERIDAWLRATGVRWGLDAAHRQQLDLPPESRNSWLDGLLRLLLGFALPADGARLFQGVLPHDDIEGSHTVTLGKLSRALGDLADLRTRCAQACSLGEWTSLLADTAERCLAAQPEDLADQLRLRDALAALRADAARARCDERVPLDVARKLLDAALNDAAPGAVPGGCVSFAGIGPLRGLPYRVLCIVGLDASAFPLNPPIAEFDLMALLPRLGDRARREDDRGAFLDALLAAREVFYLGYTGRSIRDNARLPPSLLVSELLEYLARHTLGGRAVIQQQVVVHHPLQAFGPAGFHPGVEQSHASELLPAARALQRPVGQRQALPPLFDTDQPLPEPATDWRQIELDQLVWFLRHPVRALLRDRLGLQCAAARDQIAAEEPFLLDQSAGWDLDAQLLQWCLADLSDSAITALALAGQDLPHGSWGRRLLSTRLAPARAFAQTLRAQAPQPLLPARPFTLQLGAFTLSGCLDGLSAQGRFASSFRKSGVNDLLELWVRHLVLNLLPADAMVRSSRLLMRDAQWTLPALAEARAPLVDLLELYGDGLRRPLPLCPQSALALVQKGGDADKALKVWIGSEHHAGERENAWYRLLYRDRPDQLPAGFAACAQRVFGPLMQHLQAVA